MERKRFSLDDYNKKQAFADATKFFIIYEGEVKEPKYFEAFNRFYLNPKTAYIHHIFENDTEVLGTQPKKLIERAQSFIANPPKDLQVTPTEEDKFRFVLDVDDIEKSEFDELYQFCLSLPDANLFISNYCFEVWLWMHLDDVENIKCSTSADMKTELGEKHTEHKMKRYPTSYLEVERINRAIAHAEKADENSKDYFPREKSTKVYQLMQELLEYAIDNKFVNDPETI